MKTFEQFINESVEDDVVSKFNEIISNLHIDELFIRFDFIEDDIDTDMVTLDDEIYYLYKDELKIIYSKNDKTIGLPNKSLIDLYYKDYDLLIHKILDYLSEINICEDSFIRELFDEKFTEDIKKHFNNEKI